MQDPIYRFCNGLISYNVGFSLLVFLPGFDLILNAIHSFLLLFPFLCSAAPCFVFVENGFMTIKQKNKLGWATYV